MIIRRSIRPVATTLEAQRDARAPDLAEYLVGFRRWRLAGTALRPLGIGFDGWDGGREVEAVCTVVEDFRARTGTIAHMRPGRERPSFCWHESPDPDCDCGLYAWHDVMTIAEQAAMPDRVAGAIAARGAIEVHRTGFRAQFARPVLFAYDDAAGNRAATELLGLFHGVAVCALDELADRALAFGRTVPDSLLP